MALRHVLIFLCSAALPAVAAHGAQQTQTNAPQTAAQPKSGQPPQSMQQPASMQQPQSGQKSQPLPKPLTVPFPPMPGGKSGVNAQIAPAAKQAHMESSNAQGGGRTADINNILIPHQIKVNGHTLTLNGAGTLTNWFFFNQYVAALYLANPDQTAASVVLAPGMKSMELHMLTKKSKQSITSALNGAIKSNTPSKYPHFNNDLNQFDKLLASVQTRDTLAFTYIPGTGTVVTLNGKRRGAVKGKQFYQALLRAWLGENPISADLKQRLLGINS